MRIRKDVIFYIKRPILFLKYRKAANHLADLCAPYEKEQKAKHLKEQQIRLDMSHTCQKFDCFNLYTKYHRGLLTLEEYNKWYDNHCGKCVYMHETCMYGE